MVSVTLENISKRYDDIVALHRVSFTAPDKKITVILGPSGCGKTTTLRIIAGFIEPDEGIIKFNDTIINDLPPQKRNVGFVFQNISLFPHLTVFQNIAFGLEIRKYSKDEIKRRVLELIDLLGLNGLEDRYPRELSGGQQQRVGLARALAPYPNVLLLDEPLSSLDANLREQLKWEIKSIQRKTGVTAIYVTHDLSEAFTIGDYIIIMNNGRIIQKGIPEEIMKSPANRFVAEFLRFSNFFEGNVVHTDEKYEYIRTTKGTIFAALKMHQVNDKVLFSIRPERFRIYLNKHNMLKNKKANIIEGTIRSIRFESHYYMIEVETKEGILRVISTEFNELGEKYLGKHCYLETSPENITFIKNKNY